jgi:hypothetical protein
LLKRSENLDPLGSEPSKGPIFRRICMPYETFHLLFYRRVIINRCPIQNCGVIFPAEKITLRDMRRVFRDCSNTANFGGNVRRKQYPRSNRLISWFFLYYLN